MNPIGSRFVCTSGDDLFAAARRETLESQRSGGMAFARSTVSVSGKALAAGSFPTGYGQHRLGGFLLWRIDRYDTRKTDEKFTMKWWESNVFFDSEALLATKLIPRKSVFKRICLVLNESSVGAPSNVIILGLLMTTYLGIMIFARGNAVFAVLAQWLLMILLIWAPLFYLLYDLPRGFQRIWVLGVSPSRVVPFSRRHVSNAVAGAGLSSGAPVDRGCDRPRNPMSSATD